MPAVRAESTKLSGISACARIRSRQPSPSQVASPRSTSCSGGVRPSGGPPWRSRSPGGRSPGSQARARATPSTLWSSRNTCLVAPDVGVRGPLTPVSGVGCRKCRGSPDSGVTGDELSGVTFCRGSVGSSGAIPAASPLSFCRGRSVTPASNWSCVWDSPTSRYSVRRPGLLIRRMNPSSSSWESTRRTLRSVITARCAIREIDGSHVSERSMWASASSSRISFWPLFRVCRSCAHTMALMLTSRSRRLLRSRLMAAGRPCVRETWRPPWVGWCERPACAIQAAN